MARAEAPPSHLHWLRLSGGGVNAQGSEIAQPSVNAGEWGGEAAQGGEEQESVPGKPCLGAMEGEVRLPPGESCREGECLPRAQGPGVWLAMRPGGRPRVVCGARKGIHRLLMHSFTRLFIQPAWQRFISAHNMPDSVGKTESVKQHTWLPFWSGKQIRVNYSVLSLVMAILRMLWEYSHVSPEVDAPTDSDSLPESTVNVAPWAEGVPGDLAGVPRCARSWLREGSDTVEGQALRSLLGLPRPPTSLLFEMKTSPAPLA